MFSPQEKEGELKSSEDEKGSHDDDLVDGPDTSSFTAFLYSFLSSSVSGDNNASPHGQNDDIAAADSPLPDSSSMKQNGGKKSLLSRSKQSLGKAIRRAVKIGGFRYHDRKDNFEMKDGDGHGSGFADVEMEHIDPVKESVPVPLVDLPEISEPSVLLSDSTRNVLYASLPALIHGRKWLLLYRYA